MSADNGEYVKYRLMTTDITTKEDPLEAIAAKARELDTFISTRISEIKTYSASRTLSKKEIQQMNIEKTLELQQRIIEEGIL